MKPQQTPLIARRPLRHLIALAGLAALAVLLLPALALAVPQTPEPTPEPEVVLEGEDVAPTGLYDAPVIEEEDLPPADSLNDEGELLIRPEPTDDPYDLLERDRLLDGDIDNERPASVPASVEVELEDSSALEEEMNALAGTDAPDLDYEADAYATGSTADRLPATASPVPLLLAAGLLALSFALVMAIARFRRDDRDRALARSIVNHQIDRRLHGTD